MYLLAEEAKKLYKILENITKTTILNDILVEIPKEQIVWVRIAECNDNLVFSKKALWQTQKGEIIRIDAMLMYANQMNFEKVYIALEKISENQTFYLRNREQAYINSFQPYYNIQKDVFGWGKDKSNQ